VDRVVPFAVKGVPSDMETIHLVVRDDDSLRVMGGVQFASHGKPGLGCGCCDQIDDVTVADERLGLPAHCDEGEQPVLYFIPLACARRQVAHHDVDAEFGGQTLQLDLP
jgi:hypothetical protein